MFKNRIRCVCRFKGQNGSMGLKTGDIHILTIEEKADIVVDSILYVKRGKNKTSRHFICRYSNWNKFLENWEIIK